MFRISYDVENNIWLYRKIKKTQLIEPGQNTVYFSFLFVFNKRTVDKKQNPEDHDFPTSYHKQGKIYFPKL